MASGGVVLVVALLAAVVVGGGIVFLAPGLLTEEEPTFDVRGDDDDEEVTMTGTHLGIGDKLEIECENKDTLTNTGLTEGTNMVCTQLGLAEDGFYLVDTGTDNIIDIDNENGYVHVNFQEVAGQGWYLDAEELKARNAGRVVDIEYGDWDDDNDNGWIVTFHTNRMKPQEVLDSIPILQLKVPWHDENVIALNAPTDQSSLGTSPVNIDIYWEGTGTEGDTTIYKQIKLEWNSTAGESEVDEGDSWVTFQYHDKNGNLQTEKLLFNDVDDVVFTTTATRWEWDVGSEFAEAPLYEFREGQSTKNYFTTRIDADLATSDVRTAKLIIETWDAAETPNTTEDDTIQLSA